VGVCSPAQRTGRARVAALRRRQQHHVPAPPADHTTGVHIYQQPGGGTQMLLAPSWGRDLNPNGPSESPQLTPPAP
jgi:hypothetical protein